MDGGRIIDLDEIRRVRKQAAENTQVHKEKTPTAPVRLAVKGKDQIEFTIDGSTFSLTEQVAHSWAKNLHDAVYRSKMFSEPACPFCERQVCRRVHPGQEWHRKNDGKAAIVKSVFGARIQLEQESGRVTTVNGIHRLKQRYRGPWEEKLSVLLSRRK
jgi:hypothetical protein